MNSGDAGTWGRGDERGATRTGESKSAVLTSFEELHVWQTGRELVRGVYRATQSQRLRRERSLCSQMTRAAISIPSNIAEGFERGSRKQQIESCYLAKGSAGELRTQLILAHDPNLLDKTAFDWLLEKCDHCSRQLAVYLRHLKQSSQRIRGAKFVADERCQRISAPGTGIGATSVNAVPTSPPPHVPTQE